MRIKTFLVGALFVLPLFAVSSTTVNAQSFFQALFGFSKPAPKAHSAQPQRPNTARQKTADARTRSPFKSGAIQVKSQRSGFVSGGYRTICVRTCDGFYFPISSATAYSQFHKDSRTCQSRCGASAQLFYLPRRSDNIKQARSLSGHTYSDLKNAFKYRKTLINGCTCRPMPWSTAERSRHRRYEYVDAVQKSYALAKARAKKRHEEEVARAAKEANQRGMNGDNSNEVAKTPSETPEDKAVVFTNRVNFSKRWAEASKQFSAPYYAVGQAPKTLASTDVEPVEQDLYSGDNAIASTPITPGSQTHRRRIASTTDNAIGTGRDAKSKTTKRKSKRKPKKKKSNVAYSGFFGNQKSKYSWPGD